MTIIDNKNHHFSFSMIDFKNIDPFPYQHSKYFDENSLRELGSILLILKELIWIKFIFLYERLIA